MEQDINQIHLDNKMTNADKILPGAYLAAERESRGVALDYIANKLNLRVQVLEYLESDQYDKLPQAVFVNGYIRAYCKFLNLNQADELIAAYTTAYPQEVKYEKLLFQNTVPHPMETEHWLRRVTWSFAVVALLAVAFLWYQNKGNEQLLPKWQMHTMPQKNTEQYTEHKVDVTVTDLSKMRQILGQQTTTNSSLISDSLE